MSLHCLALLGPKNEPLYLCAAPSHGNENTDDDNAAPNEDEDVFGFLGDSSGQETNTTQKTRKPSIRYEVIWSILEKCGFGASLSVISNLAFLFCIHFDVDRQTMIHASLDRLEELLGSSSKKATSYGKFQRGSHWLGCICPMEEFEVGC